MLGHEQEKHRDFSEELTNLSHHKTSVSIITATQSQRRIGLEDSGAIHTLPGTGLAQQERGAEVPSAVGKVSGPQWLVLGVCHWDMGTGLRHVGRKLLAALPH